MRSAETEHWKLDTAGNSGSLRHEHRHGGNGYQAMLAFVFPGQGSQKTGMGKELAANFKAAADVYKEADEALGFSLSTLCFEGPEAELRLTQNSQPAILATSIAAARVVRQEFDLSPDVVAGHSLGEFSALVCTGALSLQDGVRLVRRRGEFMQRAVAEGVGAMAALVGVDGDVAHQICAEAIASAVGSEHCVLELANENGAKQIVIAGHAEAVTRAVALAKARRVRAVPLKVSAPFHCSLMQPAADELAKALDSVAFARPCCPVVANVDAQPHQSADEISDLLFRQVTGAVRWEASVKQLASMGVSRVLELGPGRVLSGLIKRIDRGLVVSNVGTPTDLEPLRDEFLAAGLHVDGQRLGA